MTCPDCKGEKKIRTVIDFKVRYIDIVGYKPDGRFHIEPVGTGTVVERSCQRCDATGQIEQEARI